MNLFRDCISRILEKKLTLLIFAVVFLCGIILGIAFVKTPAVYYYHLNLCDRFVDRVCYSERNVFVIFFERTLGHAVILAVVLLGGIHIAGLFLPAAVLLFRACTFGGSLAVFFSVYRLSGVLIVFVLYLPIHLLLDAVFLGAAVISVSRAPRFRFAKADFTELLHDFLALAVLVVLICLLEMILLFALFHPLGNIL